MCRICGGNVSTTRYEYDEFGELDFWSCPHCKFDRIGCFYLKRAGYDPYYVHSQLSGREGFHGVNIDTYEKVLRGLMELKLKREENQ